MTSRCPSPLPPSSPQRTPPLPSLHTLPLQLLLASSSLLAPPRRPATLPPSHTATRCHRAGSCCGASARKAAEPEKPTKNSSSLLFSSPSLPHLINTHFTPAPVAAAARELRTCCPPLIPSLSLSLCLCKCHCPDFESQLGSDHGDDGGGVRRPHCHPSPPRRWRRRRRGRRLVPFPRWLSFLFLVLFGLFAGEQRFDQWGKVWLVRD